MRFCTAAVCLAEAASSRYRNDVELEAAMSCHDLHQNVKLAAADGKTCCGIGAICHAKLLPAGSVASVRGLVGQTTCIWHFQQSS